MKLEGLKILVCLPGDNFSGKFLQSFSLLLNYFTQKKIVYALNFVVCPIVHLARELCLSKVKVPEFDYVLWIDSDIVFDGEQLEKLLLADKNVVGAKYKCLENKWVCGYEDKESKKLTRATDDDFAIDNQVLEVDYIGFGFLLIKTGVIAKLPKNPFKPLNDFEYEHGEDYTFCGRIKDAGERIFAHKDVWVLHEKKFAI